MGARGKKTGRGGNLVKAMINRSLNRSLRGQTLRSGEDPRPYNRVPWNSIVIELVNTIERPNAAMTIAQIRQGLIYQLWGQNMPDMQIRFRILSIKAYTESLEHSDFVNLVVNDWAHYEDIKHDLSDSNGKNHFASVGVILSDDMSETVFDNSDDAKTILSVDAKKGSDVNVRLRMLWAPRTSHDTSIGLWKLSGNSSKLPVGTHPGDSTDLGKTTGYTPDESVHTQE